MEMKKKLSSQLDLQLRESREPICLFTTGPLVTRTVPSNYLLNKWTCEVGNFIFDKVI